MENENDGIITPDEEIVLDLEEETEVTKEETPAKPKLSEEELLIQLEGRAKRLRTKLGKDKTEVKPDVKQEPLQELSAKDALLLSKADIDLDDVDEVVDFAKYRKITIAEAIKNPTLRAIIADRKEERNTALATQTSNARKSTTPSNEVLLEKAERGESKEDDIDKLVQARMDAKLKK